MTCNFLFLKPTKYIGQKPQGNTVLTCVFGDVTLAFIVTTRNLGSHFWQEYVLCLIRNSLDDCAALSTKRNILSQDSEKKLLVHCYFLIELLYFHVFRMSACLSLWKAFNSPSHKKNKNKNTVLRATSTKRTHFLIKASLHKLPLNPETVLKLFSVHTKLHCIFKASHFHIIPIEYTIVRVQTCGSESFQK